MKEEVSLFSRTMDRAHWTSALDMKKELEDTVKTPIDELRINTKDLIEQGFQFPNVATYDNVVAQLTDVQNVQDNLNQNEDSEPLMRKFIQVVTRVKKNLKKSYSDQWTDPANNMAAAGANDTKFKNPLTNMDNGDEIVV